MYFLTIQPLRSTEAGGYMMIEGDLGACSPLPQYKFDPLRLHLTASLSELLFKITPSALC